MNNTAQEPTQAAGEKLTVAVVYGGLSTEHSVSCVSAGAVIEHLIPHFNVMSVGIRKDGTWVTGHSDPKQLSISNGVLPEVDQGREIRLSLNPAHKGEFFYVDSGELYGKADVVFPILHGPFGEDGTIQGLFELAGIAYVGPGVLSSACSMDKEYTKKLLAAAGLAVAKGQVIDADHGAGDVNPALGLPVFVKPARGGSSIGISKVTNWEDLPAAIETAREADGAGQKVLVEAELVGNEVEVGVLEYPDGSVVASVPAQLNGTEDSPEGFYGFETKYLDDVVTPEIPAPLGEETTDLLKQMALKAFRALDCRGLARVDFFVTDDGPVINEINTMPGFTPISMYPQVFAASGVSYEELLAIMVRTGKQRG